MHREARGSQFSFPALRDQATSAHFDRCIRSASSVRSGRRAPPAKQRRRHRGIRRSRQRRRRVRPRVPWPVLHRYQCGGRRPRAPCGEPTSRHGARARTTTNTHRRREHSTVARATKQCRSGTIRQTRGSLSAAFGADQQTKIGDGSSFDDLGHNVMRRRDVSGNRSYRPTVGPWNRCLSIAFERVHNARGLVRNDGEVVERHARAAPRRVLISITSVIVNGVPCRQSETSRPPDQVPAR